MKYLKIVVMAIAVILVQGAMAQDRLQLKAKRYYENGAYTEAIAAYTGLMIKGDSSHQVIRNLADSYMKMSQYDKAVQLYDKIWGVNIDTLPLEHAYNYALCLRTTGNYKKSDSFMQWFSERRKNTDNRAKLFLKNKDYRYWIHAKDDDFQVVRLPQNSDGVDFAPALFANKLVFSSDRDTRIAKRNIPSDYRSKSLRIFSFEQGTNQEPSLFSESLNSKFNEASMAFSKNGDTIYLTRNSNTDRRFKRDSRGFSRLKLYRSVRKGGSWGKLEELPFNSNDYSTAHPSLSPDGKTLYFASDRPGGYGQTDLYQVGLYGDGSFSEPVNLGPSINTEGRESFPYMASNGLLLFSSDGHPGLGGMDIFVIDPKESDQGYVVNLGQGINSRYDDQGIVFNKGNSKGYMSSNRNGQTKMDIFGIAVVDPEAFIIRCVADIRIRAVNPEQGNGEANVTIRVLNNDSKVVFEDETGPDGIVRIEQPMKKGQYTIKISKEGYEIENQHLILEHDNDRTAIEMAMKQKQIKGEPALAFQRLNLPPVLFAFDSAVITDKGKETLLEIVRFINTYKTVHLKLYGHTDVAGPKGYNAVLSKKRANNALHFLTEQGIEKTRLEAQGMGESQPKTDCRAGDCPPHKNRRVDYRVVDN